MTRKPLLPLLLAFLFTALLHACSQEQFAVRSPHWGKDTCAHCRMTIVEKRYAAVLAGPGAQIHFFDDLGCALEKQWNTPALKNARLFVLSPDDGKTWIKATEARYADGQNTPMAYGVGPAKNGDLSFAQALKRLRKRVRLRGSQPGGAPHDTQHHHEEASH